MIGRVVSTKMKKTAAVLVERVATNPLYKKTFVRSRKYLVDDTVSVKDGDMVEIVKVRPLSKNKHWKISKVVGKNLAEIVEAQQKQAAEKVIAEVMPEEKEEVSDKNEGLNNKQEEANNKKEKTKKENKNKKA